MRRRLSRRHFLAVGASALSTAACTISTGAQPGWRSPGGGIMRKDEPADAYVAVAPRVFRTGQTESISVSLLKGDAPLEGAVSISLVKDGSPVASASDRIGGRGNLSFPVPGLAEGDYQFKIDGPGFSDTAQVRVEDGTLLFLETDKPIYKPGQTVKIRVLALDGTLKPVSGEATVEVMDAKGIKIFKKIAQMDDFGMGGLELPLSNEPNLGTWKLRAGVGKRTAQLDVRVEKYVLPKYEIKIDLVKEWALASDPIKGTIGAEYSYGKPVQGEVEIAAMRYVGTWQEYARRTQPINGKTDFELPAVGYAAGSPQGGGNSSVRLDVTVREPATGYEEKSNRLVTIASDPVSLRVVPESVTFKPSLPFAMLVVAETPDKKTVDTDVQLQLNYLGDKLQSIKEEKQYVKTQNGVAMLTVTPPSNATSLRVQASGQNASGRGTTIQAGYSPSGNFIHVAQTSRGDLAVGDTATFHVAATAETKTFYYEVLARGKVVFSDFASQPDLEVRLSPMMAPESRLLVYQLLPNAEVAADYVPFKVRGGYPQQVDVSFEREEVQPGDGLDVRVKTEGQAKVGLVAVDRSVFILAENRLNLQQVFDELERLYMQPQAELHDADPIPGPIPVPGGGMRPPVGIAPAPPVGIVPAPAIRAAPQANPYFVPGAKETFQNAGVVVLTNKTVPEGKNLQPPMPVPMAAGAMPASPAARSAATATADANKAAEQGQLAEVQRVRQFFPETWFWEELMTDGAGQGTKRVEAPDSITTWMCRAVALSKEKGLGIGEAQLRVFQPFFVQADLPYSAIRGEVFPAKVSLYNYGQETQQFTVDLERADWFELQDTASKQVTVEPNSVGGVAFTIKPTQLGVGSLKVTARSPKSADALVKDLIVEPEGVQREIVENVVVAPGSAHQLRLAVPPAAVPGSARSYLAITGNVLSQTMEGLEKLLQMPFGCGEQNMILFAPNVFVTRYLKESNQLKVEIMAKAEKLMLTGYQREMTYRRNDSSFSAFGNSDKDGSLWLTAFVMKTFAQAKDVIFVDDAVLSGSAGWILKHQNGDGSFDPVGFLHHQDLMGGLSGKTALTAYVAIALREAGQNDAAAKAIRYLEGKLDSTDDPYGLAISAYALSLAKSGRAGNAADKLMKLAQDSEEGLFWTGGGPQPIQAPPGRAAPIRPDRSAAIETTGYGALALLEQGDKINASRAVRWLAAQRNAYGGFGSTQDTCVALQAMTTAASSSRADVDATLTLSDGGNFRKELRVVPDNSDVLQIVEVPAGGTLTIDAAGTGQVMAQAVTRFNLPAADQADQIFQLDVKYDAAQVEVNDTITITASITFTPPEPVKAGMVVLDVSVPTGFEPVTDSVEALVKAQPKLKRWDAAGRKVILYVEDMEPNEQLTFQFKAKALYPVKAQPVASQVYSYYKPEWKGEHLGAAVAVGSS